VGFVEQPLMMQPEEHVELGDQRAALQERIESETRELEGAIPGLEQELVAAGEELTGVEVIRRHVARNPDKFAPHERENVFERAQSLAVRREGIQQALRSARQKLELLHEVLALLELEARAQWGDLPQGAALEIYQAVEAERLRIARDLHDGPAQVMANLVLEAEILERLLTRDPALVKAELGEFKNSVKNAVDDMRRFMFDLRPMALDDLGLVSTMKRYTSEYQDRTGILCRFNVTGADRRLPPPLEETLYRIIQEALTNVHRHASAKKVEVSLDVQADNVLLRVQDDGVGFNPDSYQGRGRRKLGILGMRERASAAGGSLSISSAAGQGTELQAEFPLGELKSV
jgi:two-component system sensor histidine kinase DegS